MTKKIDSLYIHFPFCLHLCNYCDFFKRKSDASESDLEFFHQFLQRSWIEHEKLTKEYGYSFVPLKTLYIGGGTPSLWGSRGAAFLQNFLAEKGIALDDKCEFTIEVNPRAWTSEDIEAFEAIGTNRFSLGIQTLNPGVLPLLDRTHNIDDVYETLTFFRDKNVNFSVDFMLGLPRSAQFKRDIADELKQVSAYNPKHFSVYILTVKDNYKHYLELPNEDWIHDEYMLTSDTLKGMGYQHYEVSNFAFPGFESVHNLNYWNSKTVAALGASATGFLTEELIRYKWKTQEAQLEKEILTKSEFRLERVYMALRSSIGLSHEDLGISSAEFNSILEKWKKANIVQEINPRVKLNSAGYLILDSLMNDLFPFLDYHKSDS